MIEPATPGKETIIRITLPPRRPTETTSGNGDSGRINSSIRPVNDVASPVVARSVAEPLSIGADGARPDTETSRISVLPTPAKASARIPALVRNTVGNRAVIDGVPKPLCWTLVGVSAGVLLVEIWNYIS